MKTSIKSSLLSAVLVSGIGAGAATADNARNRDDRAAEALLMGVFGLALSNGMMQEAGIVGDLYDAGQGFRTARDPVSAQDAPLYLDPFTGLVTPYDPYAGATAPQSGPSAPASPPSGYKPDTEPRNGSRIYPLEGTASAAPALDSPDLYPQVTVQSLPPSYPATQPTAQPPARDRHPAGFRPLTPSPVMDGPMQARSNGTVLTPLAVPLAPFPGDPYPGDRPDAGPVYDPAPPRPDPDPARYRPLTPSPVVDGPVYAQSNGAVLTPLAVPLPPFAGDPPQYDPPAPDPVIEPAPAPVPWPAPAPGGNGLVIPAQCLATYDQGGENLSLYSPECLSASTPFSAALPIECAITVRTLGRFVSGYAPQCLATAGYTLAGYRLH